VTSIDHTLDTFPIVRRKDEERWGEAWGEPAEPYRSGGVGACLGHRPIQEGGSEMDSIADRRVKRALVLSGGGGRGAYQVGVCQVLEEIPWRPDMVLGNSIGATNGAMLIAPNPDLNLSGIELLQQVWRSEMSNKVLHKASYEWPWYLRRVIDLVVKVLQALQKPPKSAEADELFLELIERLSVELEGVELEKVSLMSVVQKVLGKPSLMDRAGWRRLLEQKVGFQQLKERCPPYYGIAVTDVLTGAPRYFWNHVSAGVEGTASEITVDHVMASSSIPGIYPATYLEEQQGREWWDGACVANSPIGPAIDAGATDIIVVLMTPWYPEPRGNGVPLRADSTTVLDALDRFLDWTMLAPLRSELKRKGRGQKVRIVAPQKIQGVVQMVDYNPEESELLIQQGVEDARRILQ
jgi:NTE family protein